MDYGYMQQPGCSSRELCRVKRSNLKKLNTVCFHLYDILELQNFRNENRSAVPGVRDSGGLGWYGNNRSI